MMSPTLATRVDHDDVQPAHPLLVLDIYYGLLIAGGHILLPILLLTFAIMSIKARALVRHPTVINLLVSLSLSSVLLSLLFYIGKDAGPEPSLALCSVHAAFAYGVPPMWGTAAFAMMYHIWSHFVFSTAGVAYRPRTCTRVSMLAAPYVMFLCWAAGNAYLASTHPGTVSRNRRFFFCSVYDPTFISIQGAFTAIVLVATFLLEVHIAVVLIHSRFAVRRAGQRHVGVGTRGIDRAVLLRVLVFGLYVCFGVIVSVLFLFDGGSTWPDMYSASAPLAAFLIFGTQRDIFAAWAFWRCTESSSNSGSGSGSRRARLPVSPTSPEASAGFSSSPPNLSLTSDEVTVATSHLSFEAVPDSPSAEPEKGDQEIEQVILAGQRVHVSLAEVLQTADVDRADGDRNELLAITLETRHAKSDP